MKRIKICGLRREEDIYIVNEARPDYAGFVFAPGRRRTVSREKARCLKALLAPDIRAVGVFVDHDRDEVIALANEGIIDLIQLHGNEDQAYIDHINKYTDAPVIKAVSAKSREYIEKMDGLHGVQYLLLDTYDKNMPGGTGRSFDWGLIPKLRTPFFLAGGLDISNIADAMKTEAFALDISSGAETDGYKDRDKICQIIQRIREG